MTVSLAGVPTSQEDTELKTFLLGGQYLMGYTGAARPGGLPRENWLVGPLEHRPLDDMPEAIRAAIEQEFRSRRELHGLAHTFVLVGLEAVPNSQPTDFRPVLQLISNCLTPTGDVDTSTVRPQFLIHTERLGNRRQLVGSVGHPVDDALMKLVEKHVRIARKAAPKDPELTYAPLVSALRIVAGVSSKWVGETVLLTSLPKAAVPTNGWLFPAKKEGKLASDANAVAMMLTENYVGPKSATMYCPAMYWEHSYATDIRLDPEE